MNDFFENTLESIILNDKEEAVNRGFPSFLSETKSQFRLKSGKIIDIITCDRGILFKGKLFELKRDVVTVCAAIQALKYRDELESELYAEGFESVLIDIYLIGTNIEDALAIMLKSGLKIEVILYQYALNGMWFIKHDNKKWVRDILEMAEKNELSPEEIAEQIIQTHKDHVSQNQIPELRQSFQTNGLPEPECTGVRSETGL